MKTYIIPAIKVGNKLIPSLGRRSGGVITLKINEDYQYKQHNEITDLDCCQRDKNGKPRISLRPLIPFYTKEEWSKYSQGE